MDQERDLKKEIVKYHNSKEAIAIVGPRQVGKTTLLKQVYNQLESEHKLWFDFENPLDYKLFEDIDYEDIYRALLDRGLNKDSQNYVFIDEIQYFPQITSIIKYLIDHYGIKFYLTGSSSYYMRNLFPESLAGRKFLFELRPLSFGEFLRFKQVSTKKLSFLENVIPATHVTYEMHDSYYEEYVKYGGYPSVVLAESAEEKELILRNIFGSYFEKDVVNFGGFRDVAEVRDLLLLLFTRIGQKLDITKISSITSIPRKKVYEYLYFLEQTFMITLLPQHSDSVDRQVAGGKKVFVVDSGLVRCVSEVSAGALFENSVFQNLLKYTDPYKNKLQFYQNKSGNEIDFIIGKKYAFGVKTTGTPSNLKNLQKLSKKLGIEENYLVSKNYVGDLENTIYPQFL